MRLIDADKLLEELKEIEPHNTNGTIAEDAMIDMFEDCVSVVENAPTCSGKRDVIQRAIRTACPIQGYLSENMLKELNYAFADGYTVVMCNQIHRGEMSWLEYILEKEVEE